MIKKEHLFYFFTYSSVKLFKLQLLNQKLKQKYVTEIRVITHTCQLIF